MLGITDERIKDTFKPEFSPYIETHKYKAQI